MNAPQFAIAKLIPDMKRMEPRNFGVVAWNRGECASRFLGDDKLSDSRSLSALRIPDKSAYFQWIDYWRAQMGRASIRLKSGEDIPRTEETFLNALCGTSMENFSLTIAGHLSASLPKKQTAELVQSLFESLVLTSLDDRQKTTEAADVSESLRKETNRALDASGLCEAPGFRRSYDWLCPVGDTLQHFKFHFALHQTKPEAVLQKVNLHRQSAVNDATFMFQAMQQKFVTKEHCAAIVFAEEADLKEDSVYQAFKLMKSVASVVNLADYHEAVRKLGSLA